MHSALVSCYEGHLRWSYAELYARSKAVAQGLIALGLPPLARIGIYAPNCSEWVVTQFAAALAGLILVNINPAYQLVELEHALNKVHVTVLVITEGFNSSNYVDMLTRLAPDLVDGSRTRTGPSSYSSSSASSPSSATATTTTSTINTNITCPHLMHIILIGAKQDDGYFLYTYQYAERTHAL